MSAQPDRSRRAFLRGARTATAPIRPPQAIAEADFLKRCSRCGDCLRACPEQVLVRGDGDWPEFDPRRGECTFCMACTAACTSGALSAANARSWTCSAQLKIEACLASQGVHCQSCRDVCGESALNFHSSALPQPPDLDSARCSGCGACISVCPSRALELVS